VTREFTHWNYRVVRTKDDEGIVFGIHEAHYNSDEEVIAATEDPVDVSSDSLEGLRHVMQVMALALGKPVLELDEKSRKFREVAS